MFYIALVALYHYMTTNDISTNIYYSIHRQLKIRKMLKYLKNWRSKLAKLQYSTLHYLFQPNTNNTRQWYVKCPSRTTEITRRAYGHHKWKRAMLARQRLLNQKATIWQTLAYKATNKRRKDPKDDLSFDSDSYQIMVDNGASYSISNNLDDFIEPPTKIGPKIKGFAGSQTRSLIGTVQWHITDDEGTTHSIILPNTSYVPTADIRMLSPQHWAQVTNDLRGTMCVTYGDCFLLKWDKKRFRKTIPISPSTTRNVGIMRSACGNNFHQSLCNQFEADSPTLAFSSTIDFNTDAATAPDTNITESMQQNIRSANHCEESTQHPLLITFKDELDKLEKHPTFNDNNQEYMHWHYRLNHASFQTMLNMAKSKLLPQEITSILKRMERHKQKPPLCSDCICSKMCRKQWKQKPEKIKPPNPRARLLPGDVVSVDQLVSSTPGLIACLHGGQPTHERYLGSTVFVDQASDFCYIFHHTALNSDQTVKAKQAFETEARRHGVTIKHYHADNGLFRTKLFMTDIEKKGQTISFAGVGAHHQNGIAEKRIGDLQRRATTLLLHAQRRWPDAINTHLWPYAIRCANETRNTCPTKTSDLSPLNQFCQSDKRPSYRHQHHFGCPVYVLNKGIQDGKKARKWTDRTRIGINLGPSPRHASSVALILNLNTGLVSPQFHCQYDDLFESTTGSQARSMPRSLWQVKCGFSSTPITEDEGDQTRSIGQSEPTEITTNITLEDELSALSLQDDTPSPQQPYITRSGRTSKPPDRLAFKALLEPYDYLEDETFQDKHPLAFKAKSDPDSMYYHQAMKQPDKEKFLEAIEKELDGHFKEKNYELFPRDKLPKDALVLPHVWQLRRKRVTKTGEISKWKARVCIDGSKQKQGIHYEETYAPVVSWGATRFFLTLATTNNWTTRQLDFVMAFTQADVERDLYMELPKNFTMPGTKITYADKDKYVLKLRKNLYGQKQAGKVWYDHLKERLTKLGFTQSKFDECVFYYGKTIFLVYTDDTILLGPDKEEIEKIVKILSKNFKVEDQGTLSDYLGVNIERRRDGKLEMTQPTLTLSILKDVGLWENGKKNQATSRATPAYSTTILTSDEGGEDFNDKEFNYRQVIGKLLYLEKSTRPDIACAVHQCARYCTAPKVSHAQAVKRICRYLLGTKDKGLILDPKEDSFDCWVDASHASEWSSSTAMDDPNTATSRMGYTICYA